MGRTRIARREFASLRREKTIVLALAIQLFIAGFSSFLLVGLVSLYDPGSVSGGGIAIGVTGDAGDELAESIEGEGAWEVEPYASEASARRAFESGRIDTVLVADRLPSGIVDVKALVPDGSVRSTVIVVQIREALGRYERFRRDAMANRLQRQPVPVPEQPDAAPTFTFTYTVLLPLLVFLPVFISGSVAADTITEEVDAGTLDLLRVTPLSAAAIVDGKMLATIALAPAQAAAWLVLLRANGTIVAKPIPILAFAAGATALLVALGTALALVLGDRQSTQLVYSLGVLVLFAGATLLPESPPNVIAKLAIGSATPVSFAVVGAFLVLGAGAVVGVRYVAAEAIRT